MTDIQDAVDVIAETTYGPMALTQSGTFLDALVVVTEAARQLDGLRQKCDHLWIEDGNRVVCTECGLDLEDWKKGEPHDE